MLLPKHNWHELLVKMAKGRNGSSFTGAQPIVLLCGGFFSHFLKRNVSATVSYGKKELLGIRTEITHLGLDKDFFLQQAGRTRHSPNTRQGRHPRYLQEEATQVQWTESRMPDQDPEKAGRKAAVIVNATRQRAIIGQ